MMVRKNKLASVLILLCFPITIAIAHGKAETSEEKVDKIQFHRVGATNSEWDVAISCSFGATVVEVRNTGGNIQYMVGVEMDSSGKPSAYFPQDPLNTVIKGIAERKVADTDSIKIVTSDPSCLFPIANMIEADILPEDKGKIKDLSSKTCVIPITRYGVDKIYRVILIYDGGHWQRIEFKVNIEFFKGERDLFTSQTAITDYRECQIAFLSTFFTGSSVQDQKDRQSFLTAAYEVDSRLANKPQSFWDTFTNMEGLAEKQNLFRSVFKRHFPALKDVFQDDISGKNVSLSCFEANSLNSTLIYGGERNIYLDAYLRFLFLKNKPILSKVHNTEMLRVNRYYQYNWGQYTKITEEEGAAIATAALRYLTWGVEYTLAGEENVYIPSIFKSNPQIIDWMQNAKTKQLDNRNNNYLPVDTAIISNDFWTDGAIKVLQTTPFTNGQGCPLPYTPKGIDSPRTFAYKMWEQYRARQWMEAHVPQKGAPSGFLSTAAFPGVANTSSLGYFHGGYTVEKAIFNFFGKAISINIKTKLYDNYPSGFTPVAGVNFAPYSDKDDVIKPFLPGSGEAGTGSNDGVGPNNTDRMAGVDSIGVLVGSIAMAGTPSQSYLLSAIMGTSNIKPAVSLDTFFRMEEQKMVVGLDWKGKPAFYIDPKSRNSVLQGKYRLSRADIERCTVVVPDISKVQVGDLLLRDDTSGGFQLGIVVGFFPGPKPTDDQDGFEYMSQVRVLSTDEKNKKVYLSTWAGGSFTDEPRAFQIRRLLKCIESEMKSYVSDGWELVDTSYSGLSITITDSSQYITTSIPANFTRWIPNTGEMLYLQSISIKRQNAWGIEEEIPAGEKIPIIALGPKDYGFESEELLGASNIYTNKGNAAIEFCAVKGLLDTTGIVIARFFRQDGLDEYRVEPGDCYENGSWKLKTGYSFYADNLGLHFTGGGNITSQFGIRGKAGETVRPGDDFLLRFGQVIDKSENGPEDLILSGTMSEKYFVSFYDKKLLWRANLFIEEINNDWNDNNPWIGGNEWNIDYRDADKDGNATEQGNGKQAIDILPWTPRPTNVPESNRTVDNSVSYSWSGNDTPMHYNNKLMQQAQCLSLFFDSQGNRPPASGVPVYNSTTAPRSDWNKYITADDMIAAGYADCSFNDNYPYRPRLNLPDDNTTTNIQRSAGIDCGGFVRRAVSYAGNDYTMRDYTVEDTWKDAACANQRGGTTEWITNSYQIVPANVLNNDPRFSRVVPGDILITDDHIMIVDSVAASKVGRAAIFVIHSTRGSKQEWRVLAEEELISKVDNPATYQVIRLRTN